MKSPATKKSIFATAAGPRLRCFLNGVLIVALSMMCVGGAYAQIEVFKGPIVVSKAQGQVFASYGRPIPDVVVTLEQEGRPSLETKTDQSGRFSFKSASGQYALRVKVRGFASAYREIDVGRDVRNLFHSSLLWVVLMDGACMDTCSFVTNRKKEFQRSVEETKVVER